MASNLLPSLTNNPQTQIAGETFWATLPENLSVYHSVLVGALSAAGLDPALSSKLATTYAFNRGVSALAKGKLKDRVEWSENQVRIQVSHRVKVPGGIDYQREATIVLDRITGAIDAVVTDPVTGQVISDPIIKKSAEHEFNKALGLRKTTDVTRLIQRSIQPFVNKTIFPMKGGVYFALKSQTDFVDKMEIFVRAIGGNMTRWQIADGTPQNVSQVQTVVVDSFQETLAKVQEHLHTINSESRQDKVERAYDTLSDLQDSLRANAKLAGNGLAVLEDQLAYLGKLLGKRQFVSPEEDVAPLSQPASSNSAAGCDYDGDVILGPVIVNPPSHVYDGPVTLGDASSLRHNPDPSHGLNCV